MIQDLTFVAFLKDYGPDADMTIDEPEGYDPSIFANSALNPMSTVAETGQTIWAPEMMITYGKTPQGRYMINWPIYGNDYYVNSVEMSREERQEAYEKAKNFTRCFVYFIQTQLGMKNLGIADDVFPTEDGMPFIHITGSPGGLWARLSSLWMLRLSRSLSTSLITGQE